MDLTLVDKLTAAHPAAIRVAGDRPGAARFVVHRYPDVDSRIVEAILANHLDDFLAFASDVRRRLGELQGRA